MQEGNNLSDINDNETKGEIVCTGRIQLTETSPNSKDTHTQLDEQWSNGKETNVFPIGVYKKLTDTTAVRNSFRSEQNSKNVEKKKVDDKQYRKWFVLISAFFELLLSNGFAFNMTILNVALLDEFGKTKAETALVQSMTTGILFVAGVAVGPLVSKFGVRKTGVTGGLIASFGLIISFFATSISYLVGSVGVITGLGLSATYISTSTSVGEYFDGKAKFMALSIMSFGSGIGAMVFPYLVDFLIREYGVRGCLLIIGALMLNMVPLFSVCKPRTIGVAKPNMSDNNTTYSIRHRLLAIFRKEKKPNIENKISVVSTVPSGTAQTQSQDKDDFISKLKWLVGNKIFLIYAVGMTFTIPVSNSFKIFLLNFLQSKGFDRDTAVFLYFCMNVSNAIFRMVPGFCKQIPHMSVLVIPAFYTSIGAVCSALLPLATTYGQHLGLMVGMGLMLGGTVTVISVTTMKLVGLKNYSTGLGITLTVLGFSNICAGPISGLLFDVTGTYSTAFFGVSAGLGVATCLFCIAATLRKCKGDNSDGLNKRRTTRRRSSILPWKAKVEFIH